ncbi:MAG: hypothetical protein K9N62_16105 [Verrucomicrobia bacterium]|nr:hypothetical protein [Verrucomicrobiota bacterium]
MDNEKEAVAIDPEYAATYYDLGKCHETLGMPGPARAAFNRAQASHAHAVR